MQNGTGSFTNSMLQSPFWKLMVPQLVKEFPAFGGESLPFSQESAIGPYPESDPFVFLLDSFFIVLFSTPKPFKPFCLSGFPTKNLYPLLSNVCMLHPDVICLITSSPESVT